MLASYHNLYFLHDMMNGIRASIAADRFAQFRADFLSRFESGDV
jgi:queuine tRNA-ribosyltransferase